MTDILQMATGLLRLLPHRTIRYSRGEDYVNLENATVGRTRVDYEDEHGVRMVGEIRNYLIPAKDLIINNSLTEPEEGDVIIDTNEGTTKTYWVMGTEGSEAWRYTDRYHAMLRVYVRETDEV